MTQTTVLLVDDHPIIRQGCRRVLEQREGVLVAGEAASGEEALEKAAVLNPSVVFMDLNLPGLSGIEVIRQLKTRHPLIQIIVLTMHTDEAYVYRALEAGAAAYITKQGGARELEEALTAVTSGQAYLSPVVCRPVIDAYVKRTLRPFPSNTMLLTAKELEVMKLLAEGLSSKGMAQHFHTSPQTIDVHRRNIMKKLNIRTVPGLVKWAIRNKLVSIDS